MTDTQQTPQHAPEFMDRPWPALIALCLGFFMILIDITIIQVATPSILTDLHTSTNAVLWVSSAYLLAYAVPMLITGRLGDKYGPKRIFLIGLTVFTLASLWCGLSGNIENLIVARIVQGLGAALMNPQTLAVVTRIFPPAQRGKAMALWGATAGIALVVGPVLGGALTEWLSWEWVFLINVPIGVVAFVLSARLVPTLRTHEHRFDWLGVAISGAAMFALVFGIQEGHKHDWAWWIIALIVGGLVLFGVFFWYQAVTPTEPLVPLSIFRDRNFSVANLGIFVMGFSVTSMGFPLMLYAVAARGFSIFGASCLMIPLAVVSMVLAPLVGRLTDRVHPRVLTVIGFFVAAAGFFAVVSQMKADQSVFNLCWPMAIIGAGQAFLWAPISTTSMRNLPAQLAGAGSGVFNATRQLGAVIGSAAMAVLIDSRISAKLGEAAGGSVNAEVGAAQLPPQVVDLFSSAMSQAMLLPAFGLVVGVLVSLFYVKPSHAGFGGR